MTNDRPTPASNDTERYWFVEVWQELRPFTIKLCADFAIFVVIWILLLAAHALTVWLPLVTSLSSLIVGFHEAIVVVTFMWLSGARRLGHHMVEA